MFWFFDPTIIILIPGILISLYAQMKVQSNFAKYSQVYSKSGITGAQVARELLKINRINDVEVEMTKGKLDDHYDPKNKALRLSSEVYNGTSLASLGVAAHETGHAIQHDVGYLPLNIRTMFVPLVQIGSFLSWPLLLIGLLLSSLNMIQLGIYLFTFVVIFQLVTLPVEFNASSRALVQLEGSGFITREELGPTKKVLGAAALTYVAAAIMSILQLLRFVAIAGLFGGDE